jgi:23S rRNA A2030 N6-methylase RlmJ
MIGQNSLLFLVLITFFSSLTATISSCNSVDDRYFLMLDSLDYRISETYEILEVDPGTIESRNTLVQDHLRLIKMFLRDSITAEFGMQLTKYKGLGKVYKRFLSQYSDCKLELEMLDSQAADLRQAVYAKELTKEQFKVYYAKEKDDGINNYNRAQKLIKPIYSVEPDYQRISRIVDEKLIRMSETDTTLYKVLDDIKKNAG